MKARIIPKNKVICDDCSGEFDLKIEEVEIEPGIIEQFFECPYCGSHTTITITDPDMRAKIEQRKRLQKDYIRSVKNHASARELKAILQEEGKLKTELLRASAQMKKKYSRRGEDN